LLSIYTHPSNFNNPFYYSEISRFCQPFRRGKERLFSTETEGISKADSFPPSLQETALAVRGHFRHKPLTVCAFLSGRFGGKPKQHLLHFMQTKRKGDF